MRTLLYIAVVWVALLRTVLAPFSADLLDEIVELSVPQASQGGDGCSTPHYLVRGDIDPQDEGQIAESDPAPDDELCMRPDTYAVVEPLHYEPGRSEGPSFVSRTARDRLDRPPRG